MRKRVVLFLVLVILILAGIYFGLHGDIFGRVVQLNVEQVGFDNAKIRLVNLNDVKIKRGQGEFVSLEIVNNGERYLDSCRLGSEGEFKSWIKDNQVESLNSGETAEFVFVLNVPFDVWAGEYLGNLSINCRNVIAKIPFKVDVVDGDFEFEVLNFDLVGNKYEINYSINDLLGESQDVEIEYFLKNKNGKFVDGVKMIKLTAFEKKKGSLGLSLPESLPDEFEIGLRSSNGFYVQEFSKKIIFSDNSISGFTIFEDNKKNLSIFGVAVFLFLLLFLVLRFIHKDYSRVSVKRNFIKINFAESERNSFK